MTLKVDTKRARNRKIIFNSAKLATLGILLAFPVYQSTAVRSPAHSADHQRALRSEKAKKAAAAKRKAETVKAPAPTTAPVISPSLANCNAGSPVHPGLAASSSSQLKKLAQYEAVCASAVFSKVSFFVPTPTNAQQAVEYARDASVTLKQFAKFGIQPLVFFEPTSEGGLVDMKSYAAGSYDSSIDAYFMQLKSLGITDTAMGTWVPIPEGNIPVWTSVDPVDFTAALTRAATLQKKHFPGSKVSVLLDSLTYPRANDWSGGSAKSLVPFVSGIPAGLIDSFGLQGFPWTAAATQRAETNGTVADFLRVDLAAEASRSIGVNQVWLNSGTFASKYSGSQRVTVSNEKRAEILRAVVAQGTSLKRSGFSVAIHLFAEDKSQTAEATDWSYWKTGQAATSPSTEVFKAFAQNSQKSGLDLWLFDVD